MRLVRKWLSRVLTKAEAAVLASAIRIQTDDIRFAVSFLYHKAETLAGLDSQAHPVHGAEPLELLHRVSVWSMNSANLSWTKALL